MWEPSFSTTAKVSEYAHETILRISICKCCTGLALEDSSCYSFRIEIPGKCNLRQNSSLTFGPCLYHALHVWLNFRLSARKVRPKLASLSTRSVPLRRAISLSRLSASLRPNVRIILPISRPGAPFQVHVFVWEMMAPIHLGTSCLRKRLISAQTSK